MISKTNKKLWKFLLKEQKTSRLFETVQKYKKVTKK